MSLKTATRTKRQAGQVPIMYHITDETRMKKIPMKRLLSHDQTKAQLTNYFSKKLIQTPQDGGRRVVVPWENKCEATHKDVSPL